MFKLKKGDITVIGAGINGIVTAILLSKEGFKVEIIESSEKIGGQFSAINVLNSKFDRGLYIPQLTGIKKIDDIFLNACPLTINSGINKDPAGHILSNHHNELSLFPDVRNLKIDLLNIVKKELIEASENGDINTSPSLNLENYFNSKFGKTINKNLYKNICRKYWGIDASQISSNALKVVHLKRINCFEEKEALNLKRSSKRFDDRIAFPNQFKIPDEFIFDKKPSIYPKEYGLFNLLNGLLKICKEENIKIRKATKISSININNRKITSINLTYGNEGKVINPDYLVWTAPSHILHNFIFDNKIAYPDKSLNHITTFIKTKSKPKVNKVYWSWDYDSLNDIIRVSFPYNYCQELNKNKDYFMLIESHFEGEFNEKKIKNDIYNYLKKTNIIDHDQISEIIVQRSAIRKFFIPSIRNINSDSIISDSIDDLNLSNLIFASAKISRDVFYLHDLLEDGFSRLESSIL